MLMRRLVDVFEFNFTRKSLYVQDLCSKLLRKQDDRRRVRIQPQRRGSHLTDIPRRHQVSVLVVRIPRRRRFLLR